MFREVPLARCIRLAFNCGLAGIALVAVPGYAQVTTTDAATEVQRGERVEVTGSNIKRVDAEGANPVQVITRKEIERSSATNVNDLLQQITGAGGGLDDRFTNGFAPGGGGLNLRNLGFNSTLILVDGRRLPVYPFAQQTGTAQGFNDISNIPLAIVDRIEILKDGASAIYGADAVAGVVNIITRSQYQGVEASADFGRTSRRDDNNRRVDLTAGYGDLETDRYTVLAGINFLNSAGIASSARPWSGTEDLRPFGGSDRRSAYGFPGTYINTDDGTTAYGAGCGPTTQFTGSSIRGGACRYDRAALGSVLPKISKDGLFVKGAFAITPSIQAYAEGLLTQNRYSASGWPAGTTDDVGLGSNFIPPDNPQNPFPGHYTQVLQRFADVGNRGTDATTTTKRIVFGVKGNVAGFDFDIGAMLNRINVSSLATNNALNSRTLCLTNPQAAAIYAAGGDPGLGGGTLNDIFAANPAYATYFRNQLAQCPAAFAKYGYYNYRNPAANATGVADYLRDDAGRLGRSKLNSVDAKLSRDLFTLPGGPMALALGAEYRKESVSDTPDIELQTGDTLSISAAQAFGQRNVASAYTELVMPVLKQLELDAAVRYDKFRSTGVFGSGAPKVGIRFQPIPELLIRGTASEAFRAPSLFETSPAQQTSFAFGLQDPRQCPTFDPNGAGCVIDVRRVQSGNPNLTPERSKAMTLGVVLQPMSNLSISVDEWRVNRKNEIGSFDDQTLVNLYYNDPTIVVRNAAGTFVQLNAVPVQLAKTTTYGQDVEFNLRNNFGSMGTLTSKIAFTYVQRFQATTIDSNTLKQVPQDLNGTYGYPRFRSSWDFDWVAGPLDYYVGGYTIGSYSGLGTTAHVGSQEIWNVGLGYTPLKNLTLRFQVNNVFDRAPPFDDETEGGTAGYNPTLSDPIGRNFRVTATYKFL